MKYFERKIYKELVSWKNKRASKYALLIEGARRVGKTTLILQFAKKEYKSYVYIDFNAADDEVLNNLKQNLSPSRFEYFFTFLRSYYKVKLYPNDTLIIFDEVQMFPRARAALKFLVNGTPYHYLESGSLIGIKKNVENILIPSEEMKIYMYPLDFEEYLLAIEKENYIENIKENYFNDRYDSPFSFSTLDILMNNYILTGGLPQAISTYLETQDYDEVDLTKKSIIDLYINDINKFDGDIKTVKIFNSIPKQLGKIKYSVRAINDGYRNETSFSNLKFLKEAMLVNFSKRATNIDKLTNGFVVNVDFKLYLLDTGLLVTLLNPFSLKKDKLSIYSKILLNRNDFNLGAIYENLVAQVLTSLNIPLHYLTFKSKEQIEKNSAHQYEIDFVINLDSNVIPLEVKSSSSKLTKSLDEFNAKFKKGKDDLTIVITKSRYEKIGNKLFIPVFYFPFLIEKYQKIGRF